MIRINLLGVERKQVRTSKAPSFDIGQKLTVACSLILVVSMLGSPGRWDLDDPAQVAELVRTEILAGVLSE